MHMYGVDDCGTAGVEEQLLSGHCFPCRLGSPYPAGKKEGPVEAGIEAELWWQFQEPTFVNLGPAKSRGLWLHLNVFVSVFTFPVCACLVCGGVLPIWLSLLAVEKGFHFGRHGAACRETTAWKRSLRHGNRALWGVSAHLI